MRLIYKCLECGCYWGVDKPIEDYNRIEKCDICSGYGNRSFDIDFNEVVEDGRDTNKV